MAERSRVSYHKDLRKEAKAAGKGLITVSIQFPDETREEVQLVGDAIECFFARWMGRLLNDPDRRPLPDVEHVYKEASP